MFLLFPVMSLANIFSPCFKSSPAHLDSSVLLYPKPEFLLWLGLGLSLTEQWCVMLSFGISDGLCNMMDTEVFGDLQRKAHYQ